MSGGYFNYRQYLINDIADDIERVLNNQGREKPKNELYGDDEYFEKYPDEKYYTIYPKEIQEKMKEAVNILKIAAIYAQRVDWFLSGDDGEESFIERLSEDLNPLIRKTRLITQHEDLIGNIQVTDNAHSSRLLKQPKWVQHEIETKNDQIKKLQYKLEQAEKANEITSNMDWFTLGFHMKEARSLFILHKDAVAKIATIGDDTIILVGKPKKL